MVPSAATTRRQPTHVLLVLERPRGAHPSLVGLLNHREFTIHVAANHETALRQLYLQQPDLVLLDLDVPALDGWELLDRIQAMTDVPVIVFSTVHAEEVIVQALEAGAVDYVIKPVKPAMLLAHIHAALRHRTHPVVQPLPTYDDGYLMIDLLRHQVAVAGEVVKLSATEYKLLAYLLEHADYVLTFDQILDHVWGFESSGSREYVYTYIGYLRQKLEVDPKNPIYLVTEHGIGYQFVKQRYGQTRSALGDEPM